LKRRANARNSRKKDAASTGGRQTMEGTPAIIRGFKLDSAVGGKVTLRLDGQGWDRVANQRGAAAEKRPGTDK